MSPQQGLYEWHLSLIHKVSGCPAATDGGGHVLGNRLPCSWLWQARPPVQSLHVAMSAPRILSVRLIGLNFAFVLHHLFLWIVTLGWLVLHYHPFVLLVWASSLSAVTHSSDRQGYTLNEPTPITMLSLPQLWKATKWPSLQSPPSNLFLYHLSFLWLTICPENVLVASRCLLML